MSDFFDDDEPINEPIAELVKRESNVGAPTTSKHKSLFRLEIGQYQFLEFDVNAMSIEEAQVMINKAKALNDYKNGEANPYQQTEPVQPQPVATPEPAKRSAPRQSNTNLEWYKIQLNVPVTLTVIEDKGEFDTKFGKNHGFVVEIEGVRYKLGTMSKMLLPKFIPGSTLTLTKRKEGNITKYDVS